MSNKFSLAFLVIAAAAMFSSSVQAGMWNAYAIDSQGRYGYAYGWET